MANWESLNSIEPLPPNLIFLRLLPCNKKSNEYHMASSPVLVPKVLIRDLDIDVLMVDGRLLCFFLAVLLTGVLH